MGSPGSLARVALEDADGRAWCGRGMSSEDREPWARCTSEVYWNQTATSRGRRRAQVPAQVRFLCSALLCTRTPQVTVELSN